MQFSPSVPPRGTPELQMQMDKVNKAARGEILERAQRLRNQQAQAAAARAVQAPPEAQGDADPPGGTRTWSDSSTGDTPRAKAPAREQRPRTDTMDLGEEGWEQSRRQAQAPPPAQPHALVTSNKFGSLPEEDPGEGVEEEQR